MASTPYEQAVLAEMYKREAIFTYTAPCGGCEKVSLFIALKNSPCRDYLCLPCRLDGEEEDGEAV